MEERKSVTSVVVSRSKAGGQMRTELCRVPLNSNIGFRCVFQMDMKTVGAFYYENFVSC